MANLISIAGASVSEKLEGGAKVSRVQPPVAILAGGLGTRLNEETVHKPKPLVEIGGKPILWHVMKHYDIYGMNEFAIALGYKKESIIRYFLDLHAHNRNLTVRTRDGSVSFHEGNANLDWTIHLIDTGAETSTGGRIKRLQPYVGKGTFMLTWCDGISDINLADLLAFHRAHGKLATMTVVRAPSRFGYVEMGAGRTIRRFTEKPEQGDGWINGAFFVLEPPIFDYIAGDETMWEREPLERLAAEGELVGFQHRSFWQCMDTVREKTELEEMWATGRAPWKMWR